jgi:hypothetical protein
LKGGENRAERLWEVEDLIEKREIGKTDEKYKV